MAAPTTQFQQNSANATNGVGSGTISATTEASGLLLAVPPSLGSNPRISIGVSGTFTSIVLAIRCRRIGLTQFYPVRAVNPNGQALIGDSTSITLTDSTNQVVEVDAGGCDQLEVWVVSGTPTALTVEARATSAQAPITNVLNMATAGQQSFTGATTINVASATGFVVGPNGTTNPTFKVVTNVGSEATGVAITGAAAGSGVAVAVLSSGGNEKITVDAKGSGQVILAATSTGLVSIGRGSLSAPILSSTKTTINAQNGTPTAAQLIGGYIDHNTQTAGGTVTLDTAANIDTAIPNAVTGDTFTCTYVNRGNQTGTITTAVGLTLRGTAAVPTLKNAVLTFVKTGAGAYDVLITLSA